MTHNEISYLIFRTKESLWAFDSSYIHETILLPELKCIAEMPHALAGFLNYHQQAVPVIDLLILLGYPRLSYNLYDYIVLMKEKEGLFGLLISDIIGIDQINMSAIPAEEQEKKEKTFEGKLLGKIDLGMYQEEMVFIFNPKVVFKDIQLIRESLDSRPASLEFKINEKDKQVFSDRANQLSKVVKKTEKKDTISLIIVRYGNEYFGVDPEMVKEFTNSVNPTPIPLAPPHMLGFMNLRGMILPLIDIWKIIGLQGVEIKDSSKILMIHYEGFNVGILVDEIMNIHSFSVDEIKNNPLSIKSLQEPFVKSAIQYQNNVIGVLDLKKIIESIQLSPQELG